MKFLCLGYLDVKAFDSLEETQKSVVLQKCYTQCAVLRATGKILAEEGLENISRARSIRPRGGRPHVTEGPFLESREHLGSFFIVEAGSMDEAVEIASKHPAALLGEEYGFGIEVRPIQE
jgi:hypothetical protein